VRWLLLTLVVVTGCFTEPDASPDACVDGRAGCDCDAGTCEAELECVASIDKCVPNDCTPGERTCTCTDTGECLGALACREGVCADPQTGTTGNMSTSAPTTDDSGSASTSSTDTTSPLSTSDSSGSESTAGMMMTTASDTVMPDCNMCLLEAINGECTDCASNSGCVAIHDCIFIEGNGFGSCCSDQNEFPKNQAAWNEYVVCAMATETCMGQCDWSCHT
jgi:hypothetical protein